MAGNSESILAIVLTDKEKLKSSGAPVFVAKNQEMMEELSIALSKVLDASAHKIDPDLMIIVKH